jgi:DNA-binding PadR family transcriptional regulator
MRTVKALGPAKAYGIAVEEHMTNQLRAIVDLAQVYVVLKRLEHRGFLMKKKAPAPTGSGQTVIAYTITDAGAEAMALAATFYNQLSDQEVHAHAAEPQPPLRRRRRS